MHTKLVLNSIRYFQRSCIFESIRFVFRYKRKLIKMWLIFIHSFVLFDRSPLWYGFNEETFYLCSSESFLNQDEKTMVQPECECGKLWRASNRHRGKHIGRRGRGRAKERVASALHGSRFDTLKSSSIVSLARGQETLSTDSAMYFRDNRITGTVWWSYLEEHTCLRATSPFLIMYF